MILESPSGEIVVASASHLVGRSARCALVIDDQCVSGQHARLFWEGDGWYVKDLASRNGTFLCGDQLPAGEVRRLASGDSLAFGRPERPWRVRDVGEPTLTALPIAGGPARVLVDGILALPDPARPEATIFLTERGYVVERGSAREPVAHGARVEVAGETFVLHLPSAPVRTQTADHARRSPRVEELGLAFEVSRDEEHVHLVASLRGDEHDLGARAHHYLLLTLARERLSDLARGLAPSTAGWVLADELADRLKTDAERINLHVFRARKQLARLGLDNPADLVERRLDTHEMRIGTDRLHVEIV